MNNPHKLILCVIASIWPITASLSDDDHWKDDDLAHDRARRGLASGEVLPIAELAKRVNSAVPGEWLDVELEHEGGRWVYEFEVLNQDGRLVEVYVDATDGRLLAIEDDD